VRDEAAAPYKSVGTKVSEAEFAMLEERQPRRTLTLLQHLLKQVVA